jgi:hypothetical protein
VYKGYLQLKTFRAQKRAAIKIQANYRSFAQTDMYKATRARLISLQAVYRGFSQQQKYQHDRVNLIKLQAEWRRYSMEQAFKVQRSSAIKVQACFRAFYLSKKYQQTLAKVIHIQAFCKGSVTRKFVADKKIRMNRACLGIQSVWRGYVARKSFRHTMRSVHAMQAYYRSWKERMAMWERCKELATKSREMRRRIKEAKQRVQEHLKLGNKTKAGIEVLLTDPAISKSIKAVESLETATRLSVECAQCVTELGAIGKLYTVIQNTTRSRPEMQLARLCLQTLNNFSLYKDKFRMEISQMPLSAEVLAEFIESKRDEDQETVLLAIQLLRFICEDPFNAAEFAAIRSINRAPTPFERLNRTICMMEKKVPKAVPLSNNNGKAPQAANMYAKCIKSLKLLTWTIGENK